MLRVEVAIFLLLLCRSVGGFDLMILHSSDINAEIDESPDEIGGLSRVITFVEEKRKQAARGEGPPVIVLMTGNFFGATVWYSINRWRIIAEFLNLLNPDAIALGTREFSDGLDELYQFISHLQSPVVGTNLAISQRLPLKRYVQKSVRLDVQGRNIVILGYTIRGYITTKSVVFLNIIQSLKDECDRIKDTESADYVVAIGHASFEIDKKIALNSDCIRVVIGSNSRIFMYNGEPPSVEKPHGPYPEMVLLSDGSKIPLAHSYVNGKYLGQMVLSFNDRKELTKIEGNSLLLDEKIRQDVRGLKLLQLYAEELELKKRHILGKTLTTLDGASCNRSECTLGNLITDSFCDFKASQTSDVYWTKAAIGLINSGAIKASLNISDQGRLINEAFLYESLPFQEQLITVRVSGSTLTSILEHSMKSQGTAGFLQVSGLKVVYNKTVNPPEMEVSVRCASCEVPSYEPLNESSTYDVVMTKYLVEGGDDYNMIPDNKITYNSEVINSLQATLRYVRYTKKIIGQQEGRINIDPLEDSAVQKSAAVDLFLLMYVTSNYIL